MDNEHKMTLRLPLDIVEDLKWLAKQNLRSANSEVIYLIRQEAARKRKELAERADYDRTHTKFVD